jgi:hypothetical protein
VHARDRRAFLVVLEAPRPVGALVTQMEIFCAGQEGRRRQANTGRCERIQPA